MNKIKYVDPSAPKERGRVIREHREQKGYTQAYVAELLNMDSTTYSKLETHGNDLNSIEKLFMVSQILEIDFITLVSVGCGCLDNYFKHEFFSLLTTIGNQLNAQELLSMIIYATTLLQKTCISCRSCADKTISPNDNIC